VETGSAGQSTVANRRGASFRSHQGHTLRTLSWEPEGEAQGVVVLVHGYAEHAGRYDALAKALTERQLAVEALEFPGHGRSQGRRGEVASFDGLVADLANFVDATGEVYGELPLGLFGHSMGGAVSAQLLALRPDSVKAAVLSAPYLRHGKPVPPVQAQAVRLLAGIAPRLGVQKLDPGELSRIQGEVDAYRNDPLIHTGMVNARTAAQLLQGSKVLNEAQKIRVPLLIIHGTDDRVSHPGGSRELASRVASRDLTLELVEGGYHELLNDLEGNRLTELVADWLMSRL